LTFAGADRIQIDDRQPGNQRPGRGLLAFVALQLEPAVRSKSMVSLKVVLFMLGTVVLAQQLAFRITSQPPAIRTQGKNPQFSRIL
jgi:hypothetical protein